MATENVSILTVNAGSSSLKLALLSADRLEHSIDITVSNVGLTNTTLSVHASGKEVQQQPMQAENVARAADIALGCLKDYVPANHIAAIGHRIVHGGPIFNSPAVITAEVIEQLQTLVDFDPEHMAAAIELIKYLSRSMPDTPQVACFDTTFYRGLPRVAQLLALPRKFQDLGLRRYGFHGLSYESLQDAFSKMAGREAARGRVIFAHLGSGASLTATIGGKVVDTTMSLTPASGVPMSTRSGDLDPGIIGFLYRHANVDIPAFDRMVHFESGLLGVSGLSPDMQLLIQNADSNPRAADAVNLFCYQVKKAIGSLSAVLGGLDSLIFAGGIGENAPFVRSSICSGLEYLGLKLDSSRNKNGEFLISDEGSRVGVHVLHTDEAAIIAKQTKQMLE